VENLNNGLYQPGKYRGGVSFKNLSAQFPHDSGYVYHWDDIAKAPYIFNPEKRIFVTYDDKRSVELKTKYAIDKRLGGIMFWQLASDTFSDGLLDTIDRVRKSYIHKKIKDVSFKHSPNKIQIILSCKIMTNNFFSFKQFTVYQERSAFKVGTDGVLLGAYADVSGKNRILDIGTGTGLVGTDDCSAM